MKQMKILVACEFSGTVRDAFIAKGHHAVSCDLLPTEAPGPHYLGSVLDIMHRGWDMMIAHPPCTYISNAGARHLYKGGKLQSVRLSLGLTAKDFFMELLNAPIERICIENPVPSTVFELPNYAQIIHPFHFGHPFHKRTCLWLKNLPPLKPTEICTASESSRVAGNWFNKGGRDRQKNRARTFPGIANAMADQWGNLEPVKSFPSQIPLFT